MQTLLWVGIYGFDVILFGFGFWEDKPFILCVQIHAPSAILFSIAS